jgi:hypothetical protein
MSTYVYSLANIFTWVLHTEWLRWSRGSVLAFSTQVRGVKPSWGTPSFGGEVKPSVPYRRFAACTRSLNLSGSRNLGQITGQFLAHISTFRCWDLSRRCGRKGTWRRKWERLKAGGKQWQTTPKNLPRIQSARAIPVTWLGSGSCQPGL